MGEGLISGKDEDMEFLQIAEKSKLILENITDYVWVLDVDTLSFVFQNPAVYRLTGFTPEEALKIPLERTLTPASFKDLTQKILSSLDRVNAGDSDSILIETEVLRKNGSTVWLESRLNFYQEGDKRLVLGISRDISRRRKAEEEQERLVARLQETLAEKERLLKENKVLRGLLPICANCNKIRDENGRWHILEDYIEAHSQAKFTHTICPDCTKKLYPDLHRPE